MSNKAGATPIFNKELEQLRNRQMKLIKETGKIVTLTEVTSEVVKKGLKCINDEKFLDMEFEVV